MKFSTLAVLAPLLVASASALSIPDLSARAGANKGGQAANKGAQGATKGKTGNAAGNGGNNGAASSSAAAATSTSTAAGAADPAFCGSDPQKSLCLLSSQVQTGLEQDGQQIPEAGQVPSLTSFNNFINFCATRPDLPLTNGAQVKTGSCNPTPMGVIISQDKMPSCKFQFPKNMDVIAADTAFTISMAINNLETGNFVSATQNYYAAPAQSNNQGILIGHSHVVCQSISSITSTTVEDPSRFAFFKGLNAVAVNGVLTADVTGGLPAGAYKMCSINSAANHQPALVAVAQHSPLDDCVYFTTTNDPTQVTAGTGANAGNAGNAGAGNAGNAGAGNNAGGAGNNNNGGAASSSSSSASTASSLSSSASTASSSSSSVSTASSSAAAGKGNKGGSQNTNTNTSTTTTSSAAAETTTSAAASKGGKGTVNAGKGVGANKGSGSKGGKSSTTSSSAAAAATTSKSIGGAAGKGQTTVVDPPPSCE